MLDKELVNQNFEELFGTTYVSEVVIQSTEKKELILIETKTEYTLVTVTDFTHLPIGGYDVFIEHRVKKSNNPLHDMANMISFLSNDTEKCIKQFQNKVLEITGELIGASQNFSKTSVLVNQS